MNASTKAVFLSYASEDADAARGIGQALRGAGIEVWLDQSELRGGDAWDAAIRKQIKACALFMPVISANTRARAEGYFRLEWKLAVDRSHLMAAERAFLLPVVIDGTDDADALVPDKFREVQWTRLPAGEVPATFVEQVSRLLSSDDHISPSAIRQQAGAAPLPDALRAGTRPAPAPAPGHRSASRRSRQALLVMAAGMAIAAGYLAVDRFVLTKRSGFVEEAQTTLAGTAAPAAISEKSVAVLPFANLSSEKGDEYFADGISEELLNVLAKIPGLRVSARTASFQFKGKDTSAREVGRQLGVGYVVEGSVRKAGNQVRITAQLVKVADGFQVWSETFTRELKDIFAVQDEIAGRVARALQLRIGEGENLAAGATRNPAAYEAYLRGREASDGEESGAREGVRLQQQAISLDPGFALAHAALADSYVELAKSAREQRDKAYPLARASAERALALDKRIALAHIALAEHAFNYAWDWDEADRQSRMALAIDPNHYHALGHFATHELVRGRFDSALDAVRKAEERNPLIGTTERQWILIGMKRYDEAIRLARKDLADRPGSKESLGYLGVALVLAGRHDEGLRVLEERAAAQPNSTYAQAVLGWAYGRAGQATKAHAVLQRLADVGKARRVSPFLLAWVYAGLDDRDRAFAELERAYEQRDGAMPLLATYWTLDSLHGDPRFRSLLKRMKLDTYFSETPAPR